MKWIDNSLIFNLYVYKYMKIDINWGEKKSLQKKKRMENFI